MTTPPISTNAFKEGLKDGYLDRLLQLRSDYAWFGSIDTANAYMRDYSHGYRLGSTLTYAQVQEAS